MNVLSTLGYGGMVAVIGLFIVFLGLAILICAVSIMAQLFKRINSGKEAKKRAEAEAAERAAKAAAASAAAQAPAPVEEPVYEDDPQPIAVIAAAIAAFDDSGKSLVVRRVRRVSGWKNSSRAETVSRF